MLFQFLYLFFFFQAEDGIRDIGVTGVQTCALPIYLEAVTLHTGLLAAKHVLAADVAIVSQGPGNLGTGTPWGFSGVAAGEACNAVTVLGGDRKSTRLNSSHANISYAAFCLKKKTHKLLRPCYLRGPPIPATTLRCAP